MLLSKTLNGEMCLLYHLNPGEPLLNFHISMIYSNPQLPFAPLNCRIIDEAETLVYVPQGLYHFESYMESCDNINDLIFILRKMFNDLLMTIDYQLNLSCILFESKYCFIDPYSKGLKWIYLPINLESNNTDAIKRLLNQIIFVILKRKDFHQNTQQQNYFLQMVLLIQREYRSINQLITELAQLEHHVFEVTSHTVIQEPLSRVHSNQANLVLPIESIKLPIVIRLKVWLKDFLKLKSPKVTSKTLDAINEASIYKSSLKSSNCDPEREWEYATSYGELVAEPKINEFRPTTTGGTQDNPYIHETVLINNRHEKMNKLILKTPNGTKAYSLNHPIITIGRNPTVNHIVITDQAIGRCHAEIHQLDDILFLKDLNSANGTLLNQIRVIPDLYHKIQLGDVISLGSSEVILA